MVPKINNMLSITFILKQYRQITGIYVSFQNCLKTQFLQSSSEFLHFICKRHSIADYGKHWMEILNQILTRI